MTMIASEAIGHVAHVLGAQAGNSVGQGLTELGIVNEAGEFLCAMHSWAWLVRPDAGLDLVASQNYATLPTDFAELVAFDATNSLVNGLVMTTHERLLSMRTNGIQVVSGNYFGAVVWAEGSDGVPVARLDLWPTPGGSESGALTVTYRRNWATLTDDNDTVRIPSFMHGLFLSIVRAIAAGYMEQDDASKAVRLAEIVAGPEFAAAKRRDVGTQMHYGKITGGAAQPSGYVTSWDYPVSDPS